MKDNAYLSIVGEGIETSCGNAGGLDSNLPYILIDTYKVRCTASQQCIVCLGGSRPRPAALGGLRSTLASI
jgi:hypothetical protein